MFGAQLYTKRKELGLSRAKLAKLLGVTERTIVRWESYAGPIPDDIANWLGSLSVANTALWLVNPLPPRQRTPAGFYWDRKLRSMRPLASAPRWRRKRAGLI